MEQYWKTDYRGFKLQIHKGKIDENLLQKCCREDVEKDPVFQLISSSSYSHVFKFNHNRQEYFYKAFLDRNVFEPLKSLFRGSRAQRSLQGDQVLLAQGFNVPRCILIGKKGNFNFSISEAVPDARDLIQFVKEEFPPDLSRKLDILKRNFVNKLGQVVGQLHSQGIFHGDLRWRNVLIQQSSSERFAIWFVDNERTSYHGGKLPPQKRLQNLVQINMIPYLVITRTDRMTFLNSYLRENRELLPHKNELAAQVQDRTKLRLAKKYKAYNTNCSHAKS